VVNGSDLGKQYSAKGLIERMAQKIIKESEPSLFYGPPGTGKTLTANVLGNERGKHVYKIDLSMVVSKYIGETEKNLELLFARAEDKDWILFFDEADAIFGKRTNVRDAHDKYANQEVSYLLQRIEEFNGLVILATNMKNNIDEAFIRRFDDIVKFTFPNENERKEIWEKSFPEESDIDDIPNKVKKYELAGGNIINVIHYAAIQAVKRRKVSKEKKEFVYENDWALHNKSHTLISFEKALQKEGIQIVIRRNEQGIVYGMTYIDYKNKVVVNGSDLGKQYSAKGLIERMALRIVNKPHASLLQKPQRNNSLLPKRGEQQDFAGEKEKNFGLKTAIELVMNPVKENNYLPFQLLEKKRKKKKNSLHF
jgi:hypothetical protein